MTEHELLVDTLRRLNGAGIAYMLTGSMASNFWGIPRTTHDLDFVIQLPPSAIPKLVEAFADGFSLDPQAVRGVYQPPHQFNAIDERSSLKVDFWLLTPDPFERTMFSRKIRAEIFAEEAWIASAEDVILHKLLWSKMSPSERQMGDAAGVFAVQQEQLDLNYMRQWAAELSVEDGLEQLLSGKVRPKST
jgi:hypothetical protein